eukprot:COSAG04_NODE_7506_length_1116_cov_2.536873_1_plen_67_part_10
MHLTDTLPDGSALNVLMQRGQGNSFSASAAAAAAASASSIPVRLKYRVAAPDPPVRVLVPLRPGPVS